jgi:glutamate-1-semialdehyde 2,1-aminomutase
MNDFVRSFVSDKASQPKEYYSCKYLEGGVSFHYNGIHICSVPHHNAGQPFVAAFDGNKFPLSRLLSYRQKILKSNQSLSGYHACRGCALLEKREWPEKAYAFDFIGIGHTLYCNIECSFCDLYKKGLAALSEEYRPYSLLSTISAFIENKMLSPEAIIDWGGGGEPTYYSEFSELLELLLRYGTYNYIHTNGTRSPSTIKGLIAPEKVHVVCSVDAGVRETYVRLKKKDYLDRVWNNLNDYLQAGAQVTTKYIVKEENRSARDLQAFIERALKNQIKSLILDVDYNVSRPDQQIINALGQLEYLARCAGIHVQYGHTGDRFHPEWGIKAELDKAFHAFKDLRSARSYLDIGYPETRLDPLPAGYAPKEGNPKRLSPRLPARISPLVLRKNSAPKSPGMRMRGIRSNALSSKQNPIQAWGSPDNRMEYRRLGKSNLMVSVVGLGTCQLRLITEQQAIDTLLTAFDLGVNLVHTGPDYGRAESFVAKAVAHSRKKIIVASHGYDVPHNPHGKVARFESFFEAACDRLGTDRLDLFGIVQIDEREEREENVWGKRGMVEFLLRKKNEGRLGGIFCTTHGSPEYVAKLVNSGVFDALMIAYNDLGFHLLSSHPPLGRHTESLPRFGGEIFPLCQEKDVGLLIMKPLAAGLLCQSRAFPPLLEHPAKTSPVPVSAILRSILNNPAVVSVVPGTASAEEAEDNARSGWGPLDITAGEKENIQDLVGKIKTSICSRCGECDDTCSQGLRISDLIRTSLINLYPSYSGELHKEIEYFELHPSSIAKCGECRNVTCVCPTGIAIPVVLQDMHQRMLELASLGRIPPPKDAPQTVIGDSIFGAKVLSYILPDEMMAGETAFCRVSLENHGSRGWYPAQNTCHAEVLLSMDRNGREYRRVELAEEVQPGCRCHLTFQVEAPELGDHFLLDLHLISEHLAFSKEKGLSLITKAVQVIPANEVRQRKFKKIPQSRHTGNYQFLRSEDVVRLKGVCMNYVDKSVRSASSLYKRVRRRFVKPPLIRYGVGWLDHNFPESIPCGEAFQANLHVQNLGSHTWRVNQESGNNVDLLVYINDTLYGMVRVPHDVAPDESVRIEFPIKFENPAEKSGWNLRFSFVEQNVAWFDQKGVAPWLLHVRTDERPLYGVEWIRDNLPESLSKGATYQVYLQVRNTGYRSWTSHAMEGKGVDLLVYIDGSLCRMIPIPNNIASGESAVITFRINFPEDAREESWRIAFGFVEQNIAWFSQYGVKSLEKTIRASESDKGETARVMSISMRANWAFWMPGQCIVRGRNGNTYPSFIARAEGCSVTDLEGNQWIDYVMAGGSAILGYAHPKIQRAIARQLDSSALITLPHELEMQVTEQLCATIPCAEMVLFGKHGSDACTAAIRLARLFTGKEMILYSGYHGWHDWYAESLEPSLHVTKEEPKVRHFPFNDFKTFLEIAEKYNGNIAGVILEPAAQTESIDGPIRDVELPFLEKLQDFCRKENALLIFDEIITGFRYAKGSVQKATGVIPDLACFGKALSAGMPLSALVGRREVMAPTLSKAFYYPTFRGEVYSLAAAKAALDIHQELDIPAKIHAIGSEIKARINQISADIGMDGEMNGMPFRMIYVFRDPDGRRRALKRTLLQQELLKRGILTFVGFMLPSLAHGEKEIEKTVSAFEEALRIVARAAVEDSFAALLEIPLIQNI